MLGETIHVAGAPFALHYRSDRVVGRRAAYTLDIPLSEEAVPASLQRIDVEIQVAGTTTQVTHPAEPNQRMRFQWDGRDAYGRMLQGEQPAVVRVGYAYQGVYEQTDRFGYNGNGLITGDRTREEVVLWHETRMKAGPWDARAAGLGAWTLGVHHAYDPGGRVLYLGTGERRQARRLGAVVERVAGTGVWGIPTEGTAALDTPLGWPSGIALGPDGSIYLADADASRVYRIYPDGQMIPVAGTGDWGFSGDGGPALQAELDYPWSVAVGPDGTVYIADTANYRVRKVDPITGIITTVAGTGAQGFSGDGGPATEAQLHNNLGMTVGPDCSLYIADSNNNRIRKVDASGVISTVAGSGPADPFDGAFSGDGGLATQARLYRPNAVTFAPDGSMYIADTFNGRVRRVALDGIITTVAGNGADASSGDGGLAVAAGLYHPNGVAVGRDGSLTITELRGHRIRQVSPVGIISTILGDGNDESGGDDGLAVNARMGYPADVALAPDGNLYVSETFAPAIRRISPMFPGLGAEEIAVTAPGGTEIHVFDASGRHLSTRDAVTLVLRRQFTYDAAGLLVGVSDDAGNASIIERDASGQPTAIVAPGGQRTTLSLDDHGYLATVVNPEGDLTSLDHSPDGLLQSMTNGDGETSVMAYDPDGRLIRDENAAGRVSVLTRQDQGTGLAVTLTTTTGVSRTTLRESLPNGDTRVVTIAPDGTEIAATETPGGAMTIEQPDGTVATSTVAPDPVHGPLFPYVQSGTLALPSGLTWSTTRNRTATLADPLNPVSHVVTDAMTVNGQTTTVVSDALNRQVLTTTPEGRTTLVRYNATGRVERVEAPGLPALSYVYGLDGKLDSVTRGEGGDAVTLSLTYDAGRRLLSRTDPLARTVEYSYDDVGRLTGVLRPDGELVQQAYDGAGRVTAVVSASGSTHTFTYDDAGRLTGITAPAAPGVTNRTLTLQYDLDGKRTGVLRPDGRSIGIAHDTAGRPTTLTTPLGDVVMAYHPSNGKLIEATAPSGVMLTMDHDGHLQTEETWSGPVSGTVAWAYDADFRVTEQSVNGVALTMAYDHDGLLTSAGPLSIHRAANSGLLTGFTVGAVEETITHDDMARVADNEVTFLGAPIYSVVRTYDDGGRLTMRVETVEGAARTFTYEYDDVDRLLAVTLDGVEVSRHTYDVNGNRLTHTVGGSSTTCTHDAQDRLLTQGDRSYSYTDAGDLLTRTSPAGVDTLDYDVFGNLLSVALADGTLVEYVVDARNRRVGRRVNGVLQEGFLYLDDLRIAAQLDGNGNVVSRFIYGRHPNVPEVMIRGGATYRIITDHVGSPRLVVDAATGAIAQRMEHDEYGNVLLDTNPGFQPFGFAGGLHDPLTGLIRFGLRDYDPVMARFTAKDPVAFHAVDINLYAYALNSPTNAKDPSGLDVYVVRDGYHVRMYIEDPSNPGYWVMTDLNPLDMEEATGTITVTTVPMRDMDLGSANNFADTLFGSDFLRIDTSDEMSRAMIELARLMKGSDPTYHISAYNCATYVADILRSNGVNIPLTTWPWNLMDSLRELARCPNKI